MRQVYYNECMAGLIFFRSLCADLKRGTLKRGTGIAMLGLARQSTQTCSYYVHDWLKTCG